MATLQSASPTASVNYLVLFETLALLPATVYDLVIQKKDYVGVKNKLVKKQQPAKHLIEQLKLRTSNMDARQRGWDALKEGSQRQAE